MNHAQTNHLRRLLGWVRCEIGPSPEEHVALVQSLSGCITDDSIKAAIVENHIELESVPKYIRNAVKQLEKLVDTEDIGDVEIAQRKLK
jgi:hypothetical protein